MRTIAIANQKGGVGKTATAVSLAAALRTQHRKRVLLCDLDAQANATSWLADNAGENGKATYDVIMHNASLPECIVTTRSRIDLLPSNLRTANLDVELLGVIKFHERLSDALSDLPENAYDYAILDCPPNLSMNTLNAFGAASVVVIPVEVLNLRTVAQGGQTRIFVYDSLSRLISATNPESGTVAYHYDNNGNIDWKTDARGVKTSYDYDALNRIKTRSYSLTGQMPPNYLATPPVNFWYDGKGMPSDVPTSPAFSKGKLTAVKSPASETIYTEFDAVGNVTKHRQVSEPGTPNEQPYLMEYTFDLAGNMRTQKYPSGIIVETEFDAGGSIAGVKNPAGGYFAGAAPTDDANRIQYTAHGAVSDMRLGNGSWEHTVFNDRLQPVEIGLGTQKSSNDRLKLAYSYGTTNNNGNVQSQTITVPTVNSTQGTTLTQAYSYDSLNRLLSASEAGGANPWTQSYTYSNPDGTGGQFGNRRIDAANTTPNLVPASNSTFNPVNNRFTPGQGYEYDAAGNLKNAHGFTFTYDSENRQVSANDGQAGGLSSYSYDGDGRRVKKVTATNTITVFVYNLAGQMVAEYATSNLTTGGGTSYLTMDTLGTPRLITGTNIFDSTGGVKARHDYLPFGEELGLSGGRTEAQGYVVDSVKQKFTSKERDVESGLDYFGARYYSSSQGRFTGTDPIPVTMESFINPQRWNQYSYVNNNPLSALDPNGCDGQGGGGDKVISVFLGSVYIFQRNQISALTKLKNPK